MLQLDWSRNLRKEEECVRAQADPHRTGQLAGGHGHLGHGARDLVHSMHNTDCPMWAMRTQPGPETHDSPSGFSFLPIPGQQDLPGVAVLVPIGLWVPFSLLVCQSGCGWGHCIRSSGQTSAPEGPRRSTQRDASLYSVTHSPTTFGRLPTAGPGLVLATWRGADAIHFRTSHWGRKIRKHSVPVSKSLPGCRLLHVPFLGFLWFFSSFRGSHGGAELSIALWVLAF